MITLQKSNQLKAIAILMMLFLHLFNREHAGLFIPLIFIGEQPLSYYISLFCDACVPIFAFVSGYGLYYKYRESKVLFKSSNILRLKNLYLNYWIILLLFAVGLGLILDSDTHPANLTKFLLNFSAVDPSYNGAWWFFTIYVLFVGTSTFWFRGLEYLNPYLFFFSLLGIYIVAFYFRVYKTEIFTSTVLRWLHRESALYFCTLFQFMAGAFALKYDWNSKVQTVFAHVKINNLLTFVLVSGLVFFRAAIPNFIVAPFTGFAFIFLFLQLKLPLVVTVVLDKLAPHATNIWLVHMFFYAIYFREFIYSPKYVLAIFLSLVAVSLVSSYAIKFIEIPVTKITQSFKTQHTH